MAAQAPFHLQRFLRVHQRHQVDRTMTGVAAHSFIDMNAVIEIDKVGKLVDARPLQRVARPVAGAHRLKELGVGPDLRMAVHARLGGRNAGKARSFDRSVTVAAVDAEAGDMVLMAERNGLRLADSRAGGVWRAPNLPCPPAGRCNYKNPAKKGG